MASRITQLVAILVVFATASLFSSSAEAQLQVGYYRYTCYDAEDIVLQEVAAALVEQPDLAGSLLRLHFHDCFVRVSPIFFQYVCRIVLTTSTYSLFI
jgi:peroxidase